MKTSTKVTLTAIALTVLLLFLSAILAVLALLSRFNNSTQQAEEIVFEPEEVLLDEGSVALDISYSTEDTFGFDSSGNEEIFLSIIPDEDNPNQYKVNGSLTSTQSVSIPTLDQGNPCTYNILHDVVYDVSGTFYPSSCQFDLDVVMKPTASQALAHDCSIDIPIDFNPFYMAPIPGTLVFTRALETLPVADWKFFLFDVNFPTGVSCPAFVN